MSSQEELDRIILELLGKEEYIGSKDKIVLYDDEEKIVKLDLSDIALSSLPDGFFDSFVELRSLDLSYNAFESMPPNIFHSLGELRTLDISYMLNPTEIDPDETITVSEDLLKNQRNLRYLDISGNQLELIPDGFFRNLYELEKLDLSYNLLAILPPSIGSLVNLDHLYLESNFLPIEFKNEYEGYMEVQEFLEPFQQEWMSIHDSPLSQESKDEDDQLLEDELNKAFGMLRDMFD